MRSMHKKRRYHIKRTLLKHPQAKDVAERAMWIASVISPIMTIPQIFSIYTTHSVASLSSITWFFYCLVAIIWLLYGILKSDKFIVINNVLWLISASTVFVGIILYR